MGLYERKCALIVDDSRTARQLLGQMLLQHRIKVEMAESAEDALDFLSNSRPDVIFMDHLMPGMDGFQAVRAIKNNPATATIPIMMYTSQAGELYVGQARALGAVGVLPKQIQPVQVSDMLKSLHLIPDEPDELVEADYEDIFDEPDFEHTLEDVERMMEPADWGELHRWFQQMLKHHENVLRDDIEASVARLLREAGAYRNSAEDAGDQNFFGEKSSRNTSSISTGLSVAALIVVAVIFFWFYQDTRSHWQTIYEQNTALLEMLESTQSQQAGQDAISGDFADVPVAVNRFAETVASLEWNVNQGGIYGPQDIPLDDRRMVVIDGLIDQLRSIGFYGVLQIDSHVGNFCDVRGPDGTFASAPDDLSVSECDRIGLTVEDAQILSAKQSVAFANYLAANEGASVQDIRIQVNALGNASPLYPYPAGSLGGGLAGEWNKVAQQNNRVRIRLLADPGGFVDRSEPEADNIFQ
jgi:CheY-like chemotaxis protein